MKEEYKTVAEVAEHFGVTPNAVRYWIEKWELPTAQRREIGRKECTILMISDCEDKLRTGITKTASKMETVDQ